jgi:hypothetical protein
MNRSHWLAERLEAERELAITRCAEGRAPLGALQINQRVRATREHAIIQFVYRKRG